MLRTAIISITLVLFTCSCREEKHLRTIKVIDIVSALNDPHLIPLSSFSDSIYYISLSSVDGFFLGGVGMFSYQNDQMLLSDYKNCLKFTERGEFLGKIGSKGRGPEEYLTMLSIDIANDGTTYFHDIRKLIEFSPKNLFTGKYDFLKEIPKETLPGKVRLIHDSLFFIHIRNDQGNQQLKAIVTNKRGQIKCSFRNFQLFTLPDELRGQTISLCAQADIYQIGDSYGYKSVFNDTLFHLNDKYKLKPAYYFNHGKYGIVYSEFATGSRTGTEFQYTTKVFETRNQIFFHLSGPIKYKQLDQSVEYMPGSERDSFIWPLLGIFNKETGETEVMSLTKRSGSGQTDAGLLNDLDGGFNFFPEFIMDEDRLIMPVNAHVLKSYVASETFKNAPAKYPEKKKALEELANSLSEYDNPVLMVVTIR